MVFHGIVIIIIINKATFTTASFDYILYKIATTIQFVFLFLIFEFCIPSEQQIIAMVLINMRQAKLEGS